MLTMEIKTHTSDVATHNLCNPCPNMNAHAVFENDHIESTFSKLDF